MGRRFSLRLMESLTVTRCLRIKLDTWVRERTHKSLNQSDLGVCGCAPRGPRLCFLPCPLRVQPQVRQPLPRLCLQPLSCRPARTRTPAIMNKIWKISKMHEKCLWRGTRIKTQTQPADKYLNCLWAPHERLESM